MRKETDMATYHECPLCDSYWRTQWFLDLHLKAHAAGLLTTTKPQPPPADTLEVQQFAALVAKQKGGQR
jgi:hypothetical protein